ncbi:MAG: hypothetical protein WC759_03610 [Candidatus Micrarchaeia archaeon]|jgi:hypothetical protein
MKGALIALLFIALAFGAGCVQYTGVDCGDTTHYKLRLERDRCWYTSAVLSKNAAICENIYTGVKGALFDATSAKMKAECFKEVAIKLAEDYKDNGVGIPNNIATICEKINAGVNGEDSANPSFRDGCFYEVAVITAKPSICDNISNAMVDQEEEILDADGKPTGGRIYTQWPVRDLCVEDAERALHGP